MEEILLGQRYQAREVDPNLNTMIYAAVSEQ
jgi:hypothetical protein